MFVPNFSLLHKDNYAIKIDDFSITNDGNREVKHLILKTRDVRNRFRSKGIIGL